eukprot:gene4681-6575_t
MTSMLEDDSYLQSVLQQMKNRNQDLSNVHSEYINNIQITNEIIKNNIAIDLMKSIQSSINKIIPAKDLLSGNTGTNQASSVALVPVGAIQSTPTQSTTSETFTNFPRLRIQAEILFFIFYQTQILPDEITMLTNLVRILSDLLVSPPHSISTQEELNILSEWHSPLYLLIVILQLTHVCALQQTTTLFLRDVDYNIHSLAESEEGNNLQQSIGSKEGMDKDTWLCHGVRGFACLAYAILKQPEVDINKLPAADVEYFLHEACTHRAYSYIRLCLLPVLRTWYEEDKVNTIFYIEVLCELMENLAKIFTMSPYRNKHDSNDFPYVFFPPTTDYFAENHIFYQNTSIHTRKTHQKQVHFNGNMSNSSDNISVDCLEDILDLYTSIIDMRPEFTYVFWPSHAEEQHSYHPFVMKAVEGCYHHPVLLIPTIKFVGALANGPDGSTSFPTYFMIENSMKNRHFSISHFMNSIVSITEHLSGNNPNSLSVVRNSGTMQQASSYHLILKDIEGLVFIMRLLTALVKNVKVLNEIVLLHQPIEKLFSLLSCAIPTYLKGAILHTLSQFAISSEACSTEIWNLIEINKLLGTPVVGGHRLGNKTQFFGNATNVGDASHAFAKGIRNELEDAESRSGSYPITDGFLRLFEALISCNGVVDSLGEGYRIPGLMIYLEYIIDDVLMKAHCRNYVSSNIPQFSAQRWCITARAIRCLVVILQHYTINNLQTDILSHFSKFSSLPNPIQLTETNAEMVADFSNDYLDKISSVPATTNSNFSNQRIIRPKTAGFTIMSLILCKTRLLDHLIMLLDECNNQALQRAFEEQCGHDINSSVKLLHEIFTSTHVTHVPNLINKPNNLLVSSGAHKLLLSYGHPVGPFLDRSSHVNLSEKGPRFDEFRCDSVYWREKTVSAIIGLLYECSLREKRFNEIFDTATQQLSISRTENGRTANLPIIIQPFSELLASCKNALPLIAQFIQLRARTNPCMPTINIMSIRILQHISLNMSAVRLLSSLSTIPNYESNLQSGFVNAIRDGDDKFYLYEKGISRKNQLDYDIICFGGEHKPELYSQSFASTLSLPKYLTNMNKVKASIQDVFNHFSGESDSHQLLNASMRHFDSRDDHNVSTDNDNPVENDLTNGFGSIRTAVLTLLLTTLVPDSICLTHHILGLKNDLHMANAADDVFSNSHSKIMSSHMVLMSILDLMNPDHFSEGTTFIQQYPELAMDCYELIYRLCASPISCTLTLSLLRNNSVNFFEVQLSVLLYLLHLSDEELLAGSLLSSNLNFDQTDGHTVVRATLLLKSSLHNCTAWLIKTCNIEIYQSTLHPVYNATYSSKLNSLLHVFFSSCNSLPFSLERSSASLAAIKVIEYASDIVSQSEFLFSESNSIIRRVPLVKKYFEDSSFTFNNGKGGQGWGQDNKFAESDLRGGCSTFPLIDIKMLMRLIEIEHDNTVTQGGNVTVNRGYGIASTSVLSSDEVALSLLAAVKMNIYCKSVASASHLFQAWRQLIDTTMLTSVNKKVRFISLGPTSDDRVSSNPFAWKQFLYEELISPSITILLNKSELEVVIAEQLARGLVAMMTNLFSSQTSSNDLTTLLPNQFNELLVNLIQILLQRRNSGSTAGSSVLLRSFIYTCISIVIKRSSMDWNHMLLTTRSSNKISNNNGSNNLNPLLVGPSDENKNDQIDGLDIDMLSYQQECRVCVMDVIESHVPDLIDIISLDALHAGLVWRLSALSHLRTILSLLSPLAMKSSYSSQPLSTTHNAESVYGSHSFVQALQVLVNKGYFLQMLAVGIYDESRGYSSGFVGDNLMENKDINGNDSLFVSTLNLCVMISSTREGVEALLESGFLARVSSVSYFNDANSFNQSSIATLYDYDSSLSDARSESLAQLTRCVLITLRAMMGMATTMPSHAVREGVAEFFIRNNLLVTHLFRLRFLSLDGLALTEAITSLLAIIAAIPHTPLSYGDSAMLDHYSSNLQSKWNTLLEMKSDSFVADATNLIQLFGIDPLPIRATDSYISGSNVKSSSSWWNKINPSNEFERGLAGSVSSSSSTSVSSIGDKVKFTAFDEKKNRLSLGIVSNCSVLLRVLIQQVMNGDTSNNQLHRNSAIVLLDMDIIAKVFSKCAILTTNKSDVQGWNNNNYNNNHYLIGNTSTSAHPGDEEEIEAMYLDLFRSDLIHISENLLCLIYSRIALIIKQVVNNQHKGFMSSTHQETSLPASSSVQEGFKKLILWRDNKLIEHVLSTAELFPSSSFIRQVARWIKDEMEAL